MSASHIDLIVCVVHEQSSKDLRAAELFNVVDLDVQGGEFRDLREELGEFRKVFVTLLGRR
jgi:hypothetical protein